MKWNLLPRTRALVTGITKSILGAEKEIPLSLDTEGRVQASVEGGGTNTTLYIYEILGVATDDDILVHFLQLPDYYTTPMPMHAWIHSPIAKMTWDEFVLLGQNQLSSSTGITADITDFQCTLPRFANGKAGNIYQLINKTTDPNTGDPVPIDIRIVTTSGVKVYKRNALGGYDEVIGTPSEYMGPILTVPAEEIGPGDPVIIDPGEIIN